MGIYIDINGVWGPSDELVILDDSRWEHADYDEMGTWTDNMVSRFAGSHDGMTPTEWVKVKA